MELVEIYVPASGANSLNLRKARTQKMLKSEYEAIKSVIVDILKTEKQVSLERLIDLGKQKLASDRPDGQVSWLIIQVKNDMEFKDQIQSTFDDARNQLIRLRQVALKFYGR